MYHFYSLKEIIGTIEPRRRLQLGPIGGTTNTTESLVILDHTGSYPNLRSYVSTFSDRRYSFVPVD
jgi:hypothetical protein